MSLLPAKLLSRADGCAWTPPRLGSALPNEVLRDQTSVPKRPSTPCTPPPSVPSRSREPVETGTTAERFWVGFPTARGFHVDGHSPAPSPLPRVIAWTTPRLSVVYTASAPTEGGTTLVAPEA